jgi:hypothetical protein
MRWHYTFRLPSVQHELFFNSFVNCNEDDMSSFLLRSSHYFLMCVIPLPPGGRHLQDGWMYFSRSRPPLSVLRIRTPTIYRPQCRAKQAARCAIKTPSRASQTRRGRLTGLVELSEPMVLIIFNPKSKRWRGLADLLNLGCFNKSARFSSTSTRSLYFNGPGYTPGF